jgi:hypothetical protein
VHARGYKVKPTWGWTQQMVNGGKYHHYQWAIEVNCPRNLEERPKRMSEEQGHLFPGFHPWIDNDQVAVVVYVIKRDGSQIKKSGEIKHSADQDSGSKKPLA